MLGKCCHYSANSTALSLVKPSDARKRVVRVEACSLLQAIAGTCTQLEVAS